ncbi:hypothetical protein M9H77_29790 [Catharanthus roseus]|uniref:Uncharacterized protein n=1 Tax=Catharanthus roseus TaxID=4058 RepID=A0ACB9ZVE5_CATRO|nr:hypothetical protein M9H77_29790 [Catharanthus roseus]
MRDMKDTMLIITMVAIAIGGILMKVVIFDLDEYLDWEGGVEALFNAYGIFEEDKVQQVETPVGEFCDPLCKKSDYVYMEEEYEGGSDRRRCNEMLKREKIKKASRVEESLRGIKLPHAKIKIEESMEVHVEEKMPKEDFCDSMSDMSFEEGESSREEENDLEKNERTKEMSEEK